MNRGSIVSAPAGCLRTDGFNEAPIHESGKSFAVRSLGSNPDCFNEAPIHESGKYRFDGGVSRGSPASMRPRFMNRGSLVRGSEPVEVA